MLIFYGILVVIQRMNKTLNIQYKSSQSNIYNKCEKMNTWARVVQLSVGVNSGICVLAVCQSEHSLNNGKVSCQNCT